LQAEFVDRFSQEFCLPDFSCANVHIVYLLHKLSVFTIIRQQLLSDEEEAIWLYERISGDGQLDETERRLLHVLKSKAKTFPKILQALLN
jgi:hypothetical protein